MTPRLTSQLSALLSDRDIDPAERVISRRLTRMGASTSVKKTPDRPYREDAVELSGDARDPAGLAALTHRVDPDAVLVLLRR